MSTNAGSAKKIQQRNPALRCRPRVITKTEARYSVAPRRAPLRVPRECPQRKGLFPQPFQQGGAHSGDGHAPATHARLYQTPFRPCKARIRFFALAHHMVEVRLQWLVKVSVPQKRTCSHSSLHLPASKREMCGAFLSTQPRTHWQPREYTATQKKLQQGSAPRRGSATYCWLCGGRRGSAQATKEIVEPHHAEARKQTKRAQNNSSPLTKETARQKRSPPTSRKGDAGHSEAARPSKKHIQSMKSRKRVPYDRRAVVGRRRHAKARRTWRQDTPPLQGGRPRTPGHRVATRASDVCERTGCRRPLRRRSPLGRGGTTGGAGTRGRRPLCDRRGW